MILQKRWFCLKMLLIQLRNFSDLVVKEARFICFLGLLESGVSNVPHWNTIQPGSLAEIEKIYEIAIYGSDEEKISAATISLARGWRNAQLLEATLDDEGLLDHVSRWLSRSHDMDIDEHVRINEGMQRKNTTLAIEIIVNFFQNKMTSRLLSLVHRNMPSYWGSFKRQMQLIASKSSILKNLTHINADTLLSAMENIHGVVSYNAKSVIPAGSQVTFDGGLPIDLILEDALDGGHVATFSAIEIITGLVKNLHAVNGTMWHNMFLGLWTAALRLVQRERNWSEGPVPRLDTCMCILLSITTHVVANIILEEESELIEEAECGPTNQGKNKQVLGKRRGELVTCLQLLGDFQCLLTPPQAVLMEARQAAAKAIMLVSGNPVGSWHSKSSSMDDLPMNCCE